MISYMISSKKYDIILNITKKNLFYPFIAQICIDITHENIAEIAKKGYDIKIT